MGGCSRAYTNLRGGGTGQVHRGLYISTIQVCTCNQYIEWNDILLVIKIYMEVANIYTIDYAYVILCAVQVHLFAANQSRMNPLRTGAEEKSGFNKTQLRIESAIYV